MLYFIVVDVLTSVFSLGIVNYTISCLCSVDETKKYYTQNKNKKCKN